LFALFSWAKVEKRQPDQDISSKFIYHRQAKEIVCARQQPVVPV